VCSPSLEPILEQPEVFVAWFTGLPGAGKSTLATLVGQELACRGISTEILDGDRFRRETTPELGFSKCDRDGNVERLAEAASTLARAGASVLVAAIAPYEQTRRRARDLIETHARFVEVHVSASLDVCIRRDPKGHYRRALAGELPNFTGISDPYEPPARPELVVDTGAFPPDESAARVLSKLQELALVRREELQLIDGGDRLRRVGGAGRGGRPGRPGRA
jgi:adenylyl-sulfate kinase